MDNVMVQGDDNSRMQNSLQNNNPMRGNQGRNIQTLPANQDEISKVSETRDSSLQVLATSGIGSQNQYSNFQSNMPNMNTGFFDDVSTIPPSKYLTHFNFSAR